MILTQCAVCATELGLTLGKKCGRCSTRYCGPECQVQHWKEGGHDKLCKPIKKLAAPSSTVQQELRGGRRGRGGGVRGRHEGPDVLHLHASLALEDEGGSRADVACRGTAGFAHVSCLAEQAKILFAEAEENNLGAKAWNERWRRWQTCSLCEQDYYGVVRCALGWACWKTHVGRPEQDLVRKCDDDSLGTVYPRQITTRTQFLCKRPSWL